MVGVVKDLLSLFTDMENGFHHCYRVAPPQRLSSQEDAVHAIQHGVGNVSRLSPAGMLGTLSRRSPNCAASDFDMLFMLPSTALERFNASALQTCSYQ